MLTIRQIERLWNAGDYTRLSKELLQGRTESSPTTLADGAHRVPCAAYALIRIDEFAQSAHPLCQGLIRALLATQDRDGGWGDCATTALVLRALSLSRGTGLAIDKGFTFLANMQKDNGLFPRIPIRRTDGDLATTALVLHHTAKLPLARERLSLAAAGQALASASQKETKPLSLLLRSVPTTPQLPTRPTLAAA